MIRYLCEQLKDVSPTISEINIHLICIIDHMLCCMFPDLLSFCSAFFPTVQPLHCWSSVETQLSHWGTFCAGGSQCPLLFSNSSENRTHTLQTARLRLYQCTLLTFRIMSNTTITTLGTAPSQMCIRCGNFQRVIHRWEIVITLQLGRPNKTNDCKNSHLFIKFSRFPKDHVLHLSFLVGGLQIQNVNCFTSLCFLSVDCRFSV